MFSKIIHKFVESPIAVTLHGYQSCKLVSNDYILTRNTCSDFDVQLTKHIEMHCDVQL